VAVVAEVVKEPQVKTVEQVVQVLSLQEDHHQQDLFLQHVVHVHQLYQLMELIKLHK
jgi:hypothetical protein|tara:strand:+ start:613 stop:783 length:171 start_codon:yes stop_codon:yes gene_type:complete